MQRRNIDFEIPVTREQWDQLGRAAAVSSASGVLQWTPGEPEVIHVSPRGGDAPGAWQPYVSDRGGLGTRDREVARFVYNDGRPYAQIEPPPAPDEPAISDQQEAVLAVELERWVRGKWHDLLRESGLHYDSGALPATEPKPPTK